MKINRFLKNPKNRLILLISLVVITGILLILFIRKKDNGNSDNSITDTTLNSTGNLNNKNPESALNISIDSVLFAFGIKKEWITTDTGKSQKKAGWFVKSVLTPNDLSSVEINLDITECLNRYGLTAKVNEDIITKDIIIYVNNPDTAKSTPAALIQVVHSDKVMREAGTISIIIDKVNEFSSDDLDKYILTRNEFSYIFPRNLDDIEIQHKLMQHKKNILINMTIGAKDNYDADFNPELDEKSIREKVKSFNADYPSINTVLLTKLINTTSNNINKIAAEFNKFNITVINDSMLLQAFKPNENEKIENFFSTLRQKATLSKYVITVLPVEKADFENFLNRVGVMKKLGYRFLNLSEYFEAIKTEKKKDTEREEKQKQEQVKKKNQENTKKEKSPEPKKKDVKKPDTKKQTEKKKK